MREKFPSLSIFNNICSAENFYNGNFFVIRSKKIDDIHKGIKYGVWTSSQHNNFKIRDAFMNGQANSRHTFFFFTYINAPGFIGMAVLDNMDLEKEFPYFGEIGKWIGVMHLRWIFVRDVMFDEVGELKESIPTGDYRRMNEMTDGSRLSTQNAMRIFELMNTPRPLSHCFHKFVNYDHHERKIRSNVDKIIEANMMEIYKKKLQQKTMEEKFEAKESEPEKVELVVKKKLTQGELKKLKKQQMQKQPDAE